MKLVGTTLVCVLVAFGAAFLVGRALDHQGNARAAAKRTAARTPAKTATTPTADDVHLASQFSPSLASLRKVVRHHRPKPKQHRTLAPPVTPASTAAPAAPSSGGSRSSGSNGSSGSTYSAPAPPSTYTPPPPTYTPPPSSGAASGSGSTSAGGGHRHSGASHSGTTTIG